MKSKEYSGRVDKTVVNLNLVFLGRPKYRFLTGQINKQQMIDRLQGTHLDNFEVIKEMSFLVKLREVCIKVMNEYVTK